MEPAMPRTFVPLLLFVAITGCTRESAPAPADRAPVDARAAVPAPAAPPATPEPAAPPATPDAPAPDTDAGLASFTGYGDMKFGIAAADMARAWGGELATVGKEYNDACYFMTPTWAKVPAELNFMIGNGRFARVGTESAKLVAPGGGRIGMERSAIEKLYPGRIEAQPHKYTDGEYLRIRDPAGGTGVLIFETDAKGAAGKVTEWRVGVPPEVDYVEGCA
jgi:hypothetical protein